MARSFSQEARSDSQKIGETRYRMSHLPSTTAIARTLLLAGILLAVTLLATRSFFPAYAQEVLVGDEIDFEENSEDPVAVYTATDPEEENINWELDGPDEDLLSIDAGILEFKSTPNYEDPKDNSGTIDSITSDDTDNEYLVTVVVRAGSGGADTSRRQPVVITVTNVEESGTVTLSTFQPKQGFDVGATLIDPDGEPRLDTDPTPDHTDLTTETFTNNERIAKWQWATSTSATGPWNDIDGEVRTDAITESYGPRESDVGMYLRATATYSDGKTVDDPDTEDVDESVDVASAVTANPVLMKDYNNTAPIFPDQDPDPAITNTDQTVQIPEDADAGDAVGDPVAASDRGADGSQEILHYELQARDVGDDDDEYFVINSGTGQIAVDTDAMLDYEGTQRDYEVRVKAIDPSNASSTADVTIKVTNVDEAPVLVAATASDGVTAKTLPEIDPETQTAQNYVRMISTYSAADDEDDNNVLKWSLHGSDGAKFELDTYTGSSVDLSFKEPPDYEVRSDSGGNHVYDVTVRVTDSDGLYDERHVDVTETNVEEDGSVSLSHTTPEVGTNFTAVLSDPDLGIANRMWQWAKSSTRDGTYTDISGATRSSYRPVADDLDDFLRVTVTYTDSCGTETDGCGDDTENERSAQAVQSVPDPDTTPRFVDGSSATTTSVQFTMEENDSDLQVETNNLSEKYARPTVTTWSWQRLGSRLMTTIPIQTWSYKLDSTHDYALFTIPNSHRSGNCAGRRDDVRLRVQEKVHA